MPRLCILFFAFCCMTGCAQAQDTPTGPKIQPDRRDFTIGTSIVPRGLVQLESGIGGAVTGENRRFTYGDLLVRVSLSSTFEARLGVPTYIVSRGAGTAYTSGGDNLLAEFRIRLNSPGRWTYAITANTTLPTGARSVADRQYQPSITFAVNRAVSDKVTLLLNVGGASLSANGERFGQFVAAGSLRYELAPRWDIFTEAYGMSRVEKEGRTQKFHDAGVVYYPNRELALDARIGYGIGNGQGHPDYLYSTGISYRF